MKPRSIVFDLFGDYVRYRGGAARLRALTTLMDCFGVGESTVRVVMARLRKEGWFDAQRDGRETLYALNAKSLRLLNEGRARIFQRVRGEWDRHWYMVIYSVPETDRGIRERIRKELAWLGFGPLAASTYISPHDRLQQVKERFADQPVLRLDTLRCQSDDLIVDREMAARCWELGSLNDDYKTLLRTYRSRLPAYRAGELAPREALVERMRLTYDYRKFPFRDPDLPLDLLPPGWVGREAHEMFLEAHDLLRVPAEKLYDEIAGT
ncbi:MAG TPA: PaaX family transcriptional regulator C-terminal domain-containing protein [Amycolatopsis sp.]|uniref:PaaX family transcriptional regulator n=1 Tax=Amycolatopsis sp. TaxID=37632 RepID=UPI002B4744C7|nr:PaaX family transcriptional regulator C-terminal domain-containing protein [Amycolatopsis sp.]HKS44514.1 PaaX family transcriptional regulator C-terminal domain-containing protein [Amycolatopsis sp.]